MLFSVTAVFKSLLQCLLVLDTICLKIALLMAKEALFLLDLLDSLRPSLQSTPTTSLRQALLKHSVALGLQRRPSSLSQSLPSKCDKALF